MSDHNIVWSRRHTVVCRRYVAAARFLFLRESSECHKAAELKNKMGPSLKGLFGRKAGSSEGYACSDAMKKSWITCAEDTLITYLADCRIEKGKVSVIRVFGPTQCLS